MTDRERMRARDYCGLFPATQSTGMGNKKKAASQLIRLVSAAGTGFFYVKKKNIPKSRQSLSSESMTHV